MVYTSGGFYQGWERICVTGVRMTVERFDAYGLEEYLKPDMRALDIGSNCGFMALEVARHVAHVDAVEYNPFLVEVGRDTARHLGQDNVEWYCADFSAFDPEVAYDLVLSFAVHNTDDEGHRPGRDAYLRRLHGMMVPGGLLAFETHTYEAQDPAFRAWVDGLAPEWKVLRCTHLPFGRAAGGDRDFYILERGPADK